MNEVDRRVVECMWRNNEIHLQTMYSAIVRGVPPRTLEWLESRIEADESEQDTLEWQLGLDGLADADSKATGRVLHDLGKHA